MSTIAGTYLFTREGNMGIMDRVLRDDVKDPRVFL